MNFQKNFNIPKRTKKDTILQSMMAFQSFYEVAWPFLKNNEIPIYFIYFY